MMKIIALLACLIPMKTYAQQHIILSGKGNDIYPELVMGSIREARFTHVIATMMENGRPNPGYPIPLEVWSAPLPKDFITWNWTKQFKCELLIDEGDLAQLPISELSCRRLFAQIVNADYSKVMPFQWMRPGRAISAEIDYGGTKRCRINVGTEQHSISVMIDDDGYWGLHDITASVCRTLMRGIWLDAGKRP